MAHFLFTRAGGIWNTLPVSYAELANLDAKSTAAINGDGGGTWAPSSVITIGGSGLTVTGPFIADGAFTVTSGGTIQNGLTVTGLASLQNSVTIGGVLTANDAALFNSDVEWSGSGLFRLHDTGTSALVVDCSSSFNKFVSFNEGASFGPSSATGYSFETTGKVDLHGPITRIGNSGGTDVLAVYAATSLNGPTVVASTVTFFGNGRINTPGVIGPDAHYAIPLGTTAVYVPSGTTTGDWTYTLPIGITGNEECEIASDDTGHIVTVHISGGGDLANLSGPPGFGRPRSIRVKVIAGAWRVLSREYYP